MQKRKLQMIPDVVLVFPRLIMFELNRFADPSATNVRMKPGSSDITWIPCSRPQMNAIQRGRTLKKAAYTQDIVSEISGIYYIPHQSDPPMADSKPGEIDTIHRYKAIRYPISSPYSSWRIPPLVGCGHPASPGQDTPDHHSPATDRASPASRRHAGW